MLYQLEHPRPSLFGADIDFQRMAATVDHRVRPTISTRAIDPKNLGPEIR
jgi:hypothetical protein